jgi:hypothetical protein
MHTSLQEMLALASINRSLLDKTGVKALCRCGSRADGGAEMAVTGLT